MQHRKTAKKRRKSGNGTKAWISLVLIAAAIAAGFLYGYYFQPNRLADSKKPLLRAAFLPDNLGRGTVFRTPEGRVALVDPGERKTSGELIAFLKKNGLRRLAIILTSNVRRQSECVREISNELTVQQIAAPDGASGLRQLQQIADDKSVPLLKLHGSTLLAASKSAKIEMLAEKREPGDSPAMLLVHYGEKTILLGQDAGIDEESALISAGRKVVSNVYSIGRSGRSGATSLEWLAEVGPEYCVIRVNERKKPDRRVLERLDPANTGAQLYQTDRDGLINLATDGDTIEIQTRGDI